MRYAAHRHREPESRLAGYLAEARTLMAHPPGRPSRPATRPSPRRTSTRRTSPRRRSTTTSRTCDGSGCRARPPRRSPPIEGPPDVLSRRLARDPRPAVRDPPLVAARARPLEPRLRHVRVAVPRLPLRAVDDDHVRARLPGRGGRLRLDLARDRTSWPMSSRTPEGATRTATGSAATPARAETALRAGIPRGAPPDSGRPRPPASLPGASSCVAREGATARSRGTRPGAPRPGRGARARRR